MKLNVLFGIGTALTVTGLIALGQQNASAVPIPTTAVLDPATTISFDPDTATLTGWNVGGSSQMWQTTYAYDLGGGFVPVGTGGLSLVNAPAWSTFGADRILTANYASPDFTYQLRLTFGGGFGASTLVVGQNIVGGPNIVPGGLTMALGEYVDMDLSGVGPGDTLVGNNSSATQTDAGAQYTQNLVGASGVLISPTFNDTTGLFTPLGDPSFAYTWDFTLVAGAGTGGGPSDPNSAGMITIQKQLTTFESTGVIPEPVTATLSLAGLLVLGGAMLRRSR